VRVHVRSTLKSPLPPSMEEALFRIAGEALANVRRHASAQDVDISLGQRGSHVRLAIADNGRGFAPRRARGGFGIDGMRERARLLGGRLSIRSGPGAGTEVAAALPLGSDVKTRR
jgi:two-component system, NarL family, sensor kinase